MNWLALLLTYFGALVVPILSLYPKEFKGALTFLQKMFPNKSERFYFLLDFLIVPIIGALLGYYLLDPISTKASICAGLSWSSTITAFSKKKA